MWIDRVLQRLLSSEGTIRDQIQVLAGDRVLHAAVCFSITGSDFLTRTEHTRLPEMDIWLLASMLCRREADESQLGKLNGT